MSYEGDSAKSCHDEDVITYATLQNILGNIKLKNDEYFMCARGHLTMTKNIFSTF